MTNLANYNKNGYSYNHIAVVYNDCGDVVDFKVGTKRSAEQYAEEEVSPRANVEVLTLRQAAKEYPNFFCYA